MTMCLMLNENIPENTCARTDGKYDNDECELKEVGQCDLQTSFICRDGLFT